MTPQRVLGYLAQRFAVSEENLASEALTWLLGQSAAARDALSGVARAVGVDLPAGLSYSSQVGQVGLGRPDIVGSDPSTQQERLLVEAKFAAALTPQQPAGYLSRLPVGKPSLLLVVAPGVRLPTLWVELLRAIPDRVGPAPAPSTLPEGGFQHIAVGGGQVLALISWRDLVGRVLQAVRDSGDRTLAEDGEQLLALTEAMDAAAFVPFRPGDTAARVGHQISQLAVVLDAVKNLLPGSAVIEPAGRSSHGHIFYGWYARSRRSGKAVWFGLLPRMWGPHGCSPLWCQVQVSPEWSRQRIFQALSPLTGPGNPGVFDSGPSYAVPLMIPEFTGQQDCVAAVLAGIESVVSHLDAAVDPGEPPAPDPVPLVDDLTQ